MVEACGRAFAGRGEFNPVIGREAAPLAQGLRQISRCATNLERAGAVFQSRRDEIGLTGKAFRRQSGASHREIRIIERLDVDTLRMMTTGARGAPQPANDKDLGIRSFTGGADEMSSHDVGLWRSMCGKAAFGRRVARSQQNRAMDHYGEQEVDWL